MLSTSFATANQRENSFTEYDKISASNSAGRSPCLCFILTVNSKLLTLAARCLIFIVITAKWDLHSISPMSMLLFSPVVQWGQRCVFRLSSDRKSQSSTQSERISKYETLVIPMTAFIRISMESIYQWHQCDKISIVIEYSNYWNSWISHRSGSKAFGSRTNYQLTSKCFDKRFVILG